MTAPRPPHRDGASGLAFHRREPEGAARRLVVLLHGAGADAADLAGMEERYAARVPDAVWLRPDAPHGMVDGMTEEEIRTIRRLRPDVDLERRRSWATGPAGAGGPDTTPPDGTGPDIDPSTMDLESLVLAMAPSVEAALAPAVAAVNRLIDTELDRLGLDDSALAVCGFSQGGMAALHVGLARARPCAAAVSHSGQFYGASTVVSTPPVLLLVGEKEVAADHPGRIIFPLAARVLRDADVDVEEYVAKGLGHGSSRRSDVVISRFIERAFQERGR